MCDVMKRFASTRHCIRYVRAWMFLCRVLPDKHTLAVLRMKPTVSSSLRYDPLWPPHLIGSQRNAPPLLYGYALTKSTCLLLLEYILNLN